VSAAGVERLEPAVSGRPRAVRVGRGVGRGALSLVGVALFFAFWEVAARSFGLPSFILPPASRVFATVWDARDELLATLPATVTEAGLGLAIGCSAAFATAVFVQRSKLFELTVLPFTVVLQSVPIVAVTPIIALVVGRNVKTAVIIVAMVSFFPVLVNSIRGLSAVSDEELELLHVVAARRGQELWLLRFPTAVPYLFAGLRVSAAIAVPCALVAEWTASNQGLGFYISTQSVGYQIDRVWAGILLATLLTVATFVFVVAAERVVVARLQPETVA
jgi:ABC-type nitrate/sulfonate/bicarbonate transport system permease component